MVVDPAPIVGWLQVVLLVATLVGVIYGMVTGKLPKLLGENIVWEGPEGEKYDLPTFQETVHESHESLQSDVKRVNDSVRGLVDNHDKYEQKQDAMIAALMDVGRMLNEEVETNGNVKVEKMRSEFYPDRYDPGEFVAEDDD